MKLNLPPPPNAKPAEPSVEELLEPRVQRLIARFDGAIKYLPMLQDHGDHRRSNGTHYVADSRQHWTDDQIIEYARSLHAIAIERLRAVGPDGGWNNGIPYCRNLPTEAMLKEAGRADG